jgi:hypothetical protein
VIAQLKKENKTTSFIIAMSTSVDTVLEDHENVREAIRTILKEGDIQ